MTLTIEQMTELDGGIGPNAMLIRKHGERFISGRIPAQVRKELREAVKAGALGHAPKQGLLPEVFFHPDHRHGAMERRRMHAEYAAKCIAGVVA